jgi:hypothetical protein
MKRVLLLGLVFFLMLVSPVFVDAVVDPNVGLVLECSEYVPKLSSFVIFYEKKNGDDYHESFVFYDDYGESYLLRARVNYNSDSLRNEVDISKSVDGNWEVVCDDKATGTTCSVGELVINIGAITYVPGGDESAALSSSGSGEGFLNFDGIKYYEKKNGDDYHESFIVIYDDGVNYESYLLRAKIRYDSDNIRNVTTISKKIDGNWEVVCEDRYDLQVCNIGESIIKFYNTAYTSGGDESVDLRGVGNTNVHFPSSVKCFCDGGRGNGEKCIGLDYHSCQNEVWVNRGKSFNRCGVGDSICKKMIPLESEKALCEQQLFGSSYCDGLGEEQIDSCVTDTSTFDLCYKHYLTSTNDEYYSFCEYGCQNGACADCVENWDCTSWSDCVDEVKVKTCTDLNSCETFVNKPALEVTCDDSGETSDETSEDETPDETSENETSGETSKRISFYIGNKEAVIQRNANGKNVIIIDGEEFETNLEIVEESDKVYFEASGGKMEIKILSEKAIESAKNIENVEEVEIMEVEGKVVYSVSGTKRVRLFFIFPVSADVRQDISVESGEIISTKRPWWHVFALGI